MKARKLFALLLAVVMVLSLSAPAFAAGEVDDPTTGSITIENPQTGETYTAYQIFEMSFEGTNPRVPTPQSYVTPYHPYNYYIDKDSPWCATVLTYAENDDHYTDAADPTTRQPGTGLILDPVYSTTGALEGYNVTYDEHFDAALFAAALQAALANTATATEINKTENAKYKYALPNGKADNLPFGYYLVDPTTGALASLTSTDPDVVISDKNEMPKVDKVIVETPVTPTAEYDETAPVNYIAYELFHKPIAANANIEWGRGVDATKFQTNLKAEDDLLALYTSTYGVPTDSTKPGDTTARKWYDLYMANTSDADVVAAMSSALEGTSNLALENGQNALNVLNPGSLYAVEMFKDTLPEGSPDGTLDSQGYAILAAGTDGKLTLTGVKFDNKTAATADDVTYEAPPVAETPELRGIENEVEANGAFIGQTMTFKITTEVPNMTGFDQYFFVVNDKMDYALTYENDIKVYLNKDADENPTEATDLLVEGTDYTFEENPVYKTGSTTEIEAYEYRIIFKNMIQYRDYDHDNDANTTVIDLKGQPITILYTATLNQYAEVGDPALNTSWIEFSKDPTVNVEWTGTEGGDTYDPRDTGTDEYKYTDKDGNTIPENKFKTDVYPDGPTDTTATYTARLQITKKNPGGTALSGAKFHISGPDHQIVKYGYDDLAKPTSNTGMYVFTKDASGKWVLVNDKDACEYDPADSTITYTEADNAFLKKAIVFEPKTGDNAEVRENGDYWHDTDKTPAEYTKIGTGEGETPAAQVPTNAVLYTEKLVIDLYVENSTPPANPTIDQQYTKLADLAAVKAELAEETPDKLYYRTEVSLKDRLDPENNKYSPVLTPRIEDTTATTNFLYDGYTGTDGILIFDGLGEGTYTIEELIAPNGYNLLRAPLTVVVTFNETTKNFSATIDENDAVMNALNTVTDLDDIITFDVVNYQGAELPETGGIGTTIFYALGGLLVLSAGILLITRKRMGAED